MEDFVHVCQGCIESLDKPFIVTKKANKTGDKYCIMCGVSHIDLMMISKKTLNLIFKEIYGKDLEGIVR